MDDYGDDCRGKVAELEAQVAALGKEKDDQELQYLLLCQDIGQARDEARAEVEQLREKVGNLEHALLAQRKVESNLRQMLDVARKDNKAGRLEKEVEQLRAQLAETERNLMRANARLMQWESGETERVGAHALKADLQKRLAAAEQRAEKAEAALPPAGILSDIRTITATYVFIGTSGVSFAAAVRCGERVQAWLSTLPTPEAQP